MEKSRIKLIKKSKFFVSEWYLEQYPDVREANMDPAVHYDQFGWKEGRDPGPNFSTKGYLTLNPDVLEANINPLIHFEQYGYKENRIDYEDTIRTKAENLKLKKSLEKKNQWIENYYDDLSINAKKELLADWYEETTGQKIDLDHPKTFNEKIQWLKLFDSTPLKTRLADKYLVRDWVAEKAGSDILIPLLGVWEHFDEIDFDQLPDQFVLKANHGSGWNIIVKDKSKFDKTEAKQKFDKWMNTNFAFVNGFELHYKDIPPIIFSEGFLNGLEDMSEYQFWCFNGEPLFLSVISEPHGRNEKKTFDMDWHELPFVTSLPQKHDDIKKPETFDEMKELSKKLAAGFSFVRVDLYSFSGKVYFGEMTFTPATGLVKWDPKNVDDKIGELLVLK